MQHLLFAILDTKGQFYTPPFTARNVQLAQRSFAETANTPEHPFNKHADDYILYQIGTFDDENSVIETHKPHPLGSAKSYILPYGDILEEEQPMVEKEPNVAAE